MFVVLLVVYRGCVSTRCHITVNLHGRRPSRISTRHDKITRDPEESQWLNVAGRRRDRRTPLNVVERHGKSQECLQYAHVKTLRVSRAHVRAALFGTAMDRTNTKGVTLFQYVTYRLWGQAQEINAPRIKAVDMLSTPR